MLKMIYPISLQSSEGNGGVGPGEDSCSVTRAPLKSYGSSFVPLFRVLLTLLGAPMRLSRAQVP